MTIAGAMVVALALALSPDAPVTLHGIGPLRIGLTAAELRRMGAEEGENPLGEGDCNYWSLPGRSGLGLMVVGGRLARIDIEDPAWRTASGAHVGMTEAAWLRLYLGRMRVEPHPYADPAGKYLVYRARAEPYGMIVETLESRAQSMRVGYWENVQWIEGCS